MPPLVATGLPSQVPARPEYSPQCTNMPKRASRHHCILSSRCAWVSGWAAGCAVPRQVQATAGRRRGCSCARCYMMVHSAKLARFADSTKNSLEHLIRPSLIERQQVHHRGRPQRTRSPPARWLRRSPDNPHPESVGLAEQGLQEWTCSRYVAVVEIDPPRTRTAWCLTLDRCERPR